MKNPAGFLASSLRDDYAPPQGFVATGELLGRKLQDRVKQKELVEANRIATLEKEGRLNAEAESFDLRWKALAAGEQARVERQALAAASRIEREVLERGGPFAEATRRMVLRRALDEGSPDL